MIHDREVENIVVVELAHRDRDPPSLRGEVCRGPEGTVAIAAKDLDLAKGVAIVIHYCEVKLVIAV
jgi:hypothetical protein